MRGQDYSIAGGDFGEQAMPQKRVLWSCQPAQG
jgi:hypothetical protein